MGSTQFISALTDAIMLGLLYVSIAGAFAQGASLHLSRPECPIAARELGENGAQENAIMHSTRQGMRQPQHTIGSTAARHTRQIACGAGRGMEAGICVGKSSIEPRGRPVGRRLPSPPRPCSSSIWARGWSAVTWDRRDRPGPSASTPTVQRPEYFSVVDAPTRQ